MSKPRIAGLDGLRAVGIMMVMIFHYTSRWAFPHHTVTLYPYGDVLSSEFLNTAFAPAACFFFMLSGFMTRISLESASSYGHFLWKRWARLAPTFLLCTAITYFFMKALAPLSPFPAKIADFVPSLLMMNPYVLNKITGGVFAFEWMDGAYWSLGVEANFTLLVGALYFMSKAQFFRLLAVVYILGGVGLYLDVSYGVKGLGFISNFILVTPYLPWFLTGIGLYEKWGAPRPNIKRATLLIALGLIGICLRSYFQHDIGFMMMMGLSLLGFYGVFASECVNAFLSRPWLSGLGAGTYSLYLLHQHIGIVAVIGLSVLLPKVSPFLDLAAVIVLLIGVSQVIYWRWELPVGRALTRKRKPQKS